MDEIDYSCSEPGCDIPALYQERLKQYIEEGKPPGALLSAALANDWTGVDADEEERTRLSLWIFRHAPKACAGSYMKVMHWLHMGGLKALR